MNDIKRYSGKVVFFSPALGIGFLERHDGTDVLCHFSAVLNPGYKILLPNEVVEYDLVQGKNGPHATNVRRLAASGQPLSAPFTPATDTASITPQASPNRWRQGARKLKTALKTRLPLARVKYLNGQSTDSLAASDFAIEATPEKIIVSLDLSASEDPGSAFDDCLAETTQLQANTEKINFIQLHRNAIFEASLTQALAKVPARAFELAIRFKDGIVRTLPARLVEDKASFWFYATELKVGTAMLSPAWRKARR